MVDATKVSSIKIDTGYAGVKEYPFFTRESKNGQALPDARCAIVLGKNGSGKSTIARALSDGGNRAEFFDKNGDSLGDDCSNIYVFNESYVIENFRVYKNNYLDPIILLGKHVQEMRYIEDLKKDVSEIEERLRCIKEGVFEWVSRIVKVYRGVGVIANMWEGFVFGFLENEITDASFSIGGKNKESYSGIIRGESFDRSIFNRWVSEKIYKEKNRSRYVDGLVFESPEVVVQKLFTIRKDMFKEFAVHEIASGTLGYRQNRQRLELLRDEYVRCIMSILYNKCRPMYGFILEGSFLQEEEAEELSFKSEELFNKNGLIAQKTRELERKNIDDSGKQVVERINQWLRMILGEDLIQVESSGVMGYKLRGKNGYVSPEQLSLGEQNILALCYFFIEISSGGELVNSAHKNQLIVLDDPISSFDYDNKYGVMQVLNHISGLMSGNESESKMLVMTHDAVTARELSNAIRHRVGGDKVRCCRIADSQTGCVEPVKFDSVDEYRNILHKMFEVATQEGKGIDLISPNEVRRVWEAFLRFELGESEISSRNALDRASCFYDVQSAEYEFLDSFISYVYINQDSHSSDQMLFDNFDLIPILGRRDFEKHIRQIVLFIRLVAPHHIPSRLAENLGEIAVYRNALNQLYNQKILWQS